MLLLIPVLTFVISCQGTYNPAKKLYQFENGVPKEVPHVKRVINPIEDTKDRLVSSGYSRLTKGISVALLAFIVSLAFSNKITGVISGFGMACGGYLALDGLLMIWAATYLPYLIWFAVVLIVIAIAYKMRKKSIVAYWRGRKAKTSEGDSSS